MIRILRPATIFFLTPILASAQTEYPFPVFQTDGLSFYTTNGEEGVGDMHVLDTPELIVEMPITATAGTIQDLTTPRLVWADTGGRLNDTDGANWDATNVGLYLGSVGATSQFDWKHGTTTISADAAIYGRAEGAAGSAEKPIVVAHYGGTGVNSGLHVARADGTFASPTDFTTGAEDSILSYYAYKTGAFRRMPVIDVKATSLNTFATLGDVTINSLNGGWTFMSGGGLKGSAANVAPYIDGTVNGPIATALGQFAMGDADSYHMFYTGSTLIGGYGESTLALANDVGAVQIELDGNLGNITASGLSATPEFIWADTDGLLATSNGFAYDEAVEGVYLGDANDATFPVLGLLNMPGRIVAHAQDTGAYETGLVSILGGWDANGSSAGAFVPAFHEGTYFSPTIVDTSQHYPILEPFVWGTNVNAGFKPTGAGIWMQPVTDNALVFQSTIVVGNVAAGLRVDYDGTVTASGDVGVGDTLTADYLVATGSGVGLDVDFNATIGGTLDVAGAAEVLTVTATDGVDSLAMSATGNVATLATADAHLRIDTAGRMDFDIYGSGDDYTFYQGGSTVVATLLGVGAINVGTTTLATSAGDFAVGLTSAGTIFFDQSAPAFYLKNSSGGNAATISAVTGGGTIFNDHSADVDFTVETDATEDAFKVDAGLNSVAVTSWFGIGAGTALTISGGAVTATNSHIIVDTEAAAATDDLDTINATGGQAGDFLYVRAANTARTVVVKDGANLVTAGDMTLDNTQDSILFVRTGGSTWREVARSDNGA